MSRSLFEMAFTSPPDVPRLCATAAALASSSAKSLVIPTVSLAVQSTAQGEHPVRYRAARRIGEAKDESEVAPVQARWRLT
jgi:hypothetical protein